jgi:hypothetical protein
VRHIKVLITVHFFLSFHLTQTNSSSKNIAEKKTQKNMCKLEEKKKTNKKEQKNCANLRKILGISRQEYGQHIPQSNDDCAL